MLIRNALLYIALLSLALPSAAQASERLQLRLNEASSNAEQVSNKLLSQPAASFSSEDWLVLGLTQLRLRNKEAAMDATERVLQSSAPAYLQAQAYLLKAQIYGILYRDTAIAITQLERAELILQDETEPFSLQLYSDVLQNFAQAYNQLGHVQKAIPYAERSLTLALTGQQPEAELKARIILGRLALQNNAYNQAYQNLNLALQLATALQDNEALASIHFRLGMAYRKIEDHKNALSHLLQAKQRYQQLQQHSSYTYTLLFIGETYLEDINTAEQASQYLNEALTLARQQDDLLRVGMVMQGLGRLAVLQNEDEQALQYFNDALQLFRQQNLQTYLHESSLALAELLFQRQQYAEANALLAELLPHISQLAAYLQYRYNELASKLAAQQGNWQLAYTSMQQASTQRFEQFTEQNKLQLDLINNGLSQVAAASQHQTELAQLQQQLQQQQRYNHFLMLAALLLVLAAIPALVWRKWRKPVSQSTVRLASADWHNFCQRTQHQSAKTTLHLLAFAPAAVTELKLHFGEQRLQQAVHTFMQQLDCVQLTASCVNDDVLWLALHTNGDTAKALQQQLAAQLQALLPERFANQAFISLRLALPQLSDTPWQLAELNALPEAFWLSWALAATSPPQQQLWLLALHGKSARACEWHSNMVRQDLLNAIRLGSIELSCNNTLLPASIADELI
jgi:tetratricopeptide (TPR) repeat protein